MSWPQALGPGAWAAPSRRRRGLVPAVPLSLALPSGAPGGPLVPPLGHRRVCGLILPGFISTKPPGRLAETPREPHPQLSSGCSPGPRALEAPWLLNRASGCWRLAPSAWEAKGVPGTGHRKGASRAVQAASSPAAPPQRGPLSQRCPRLFALERV